jgi:4,5:9,10-diseco-3-hydroxy-5,9,17-trioxoandrosta-1(10),2-diene-4-oate hydrolase
MTAVLDAETTSKYADLPSGIRLHYHEAGDPAAETVLLLHGGGPGASAWSNFGRTLGVLSEQFHVLAVDQVGFGKSSKPATHSAAGRLYGLPSTTRARPVGSS